MASLSPFTGVLGTRRAAHLLRRTSFRYTKTKVDELASQTAAQALADLLTLQTRQLEQPVYSASNAVAPVPWVNPPGMTLPTQDFILRRYLSGWWINEALHDPGIGHKMTLFFHQYMITTVTTGPTSSYYDYLALLRWGSLGNFKKLAYKIVTDNIMLRYLNNNENTASNPNENFAREFLELFTIGKGPQIGAGDYTNYTEDDIVAAAKVLTGFRVNAARTSIDVETGIPRGDARPNQHNKTEKKFSSKFQDATILADNAPTADKMSQELNVFVNMIFAQPATAKTLCRRLYNYFVHGNITAEIEDDIITPLANTLIANNFEIKPVLQQLLGSQHFFDADDSDNTDEIIGGIIKSPLELSLQALSFFQVSIPDPLTKPQTHYQTFYDQAVQTRMLAGANFPLFFSSDVAGYPGFYATDHSHQWFTSGTIIARYKVGAMLLTGTRQFGGGNVNALIGIKLNIAPFIRDSGVVSDAADPYVLVQDLLEYMLPETVDNERFNYFYIQTFLNNLPPNDWTYEWQNYLNSGNESEVKIALERLITAIMYSPEYQTF